MIKVLDVAYARFQAPDLDLMEQFLGDFGLTTSEKTENALYMRCSDENHHTHVTELGDAKFVGFAFNAASLEDLNTIAKVEGASKIEEMDEPGGGYRVRINDPDNFQIEVVYGIKTLPNLTKQNVFGANFGDQRKREGEFVRLKAGPSQCKRLGHIVINVTDFEKTNKFYKSNFGLISSDECVDENGKTCLAFNRVDQGKNFVDHHCLLTVPTDTAGLGHIAFEVHDVNHIFLGHQYLKNKKYKHSWGIGRHVLGSQIFDYWFDPYGFRVEHWTDGDLLNIDTPVGITSIAEALEVQWGVDSKDRKT